MLRSLLRTYAIVPCWANTIACRGSSNPAMVPMGLLVPVSMTVRVLSTLSPE